MNCAECRELFASDFSGIELQIEVDTRFPNFACEDCSVSEHSPAKIEPDESVAFLTIHPIHYDEKTGTLSPIAFQQLTKNDLSVLRLAYATSSEFDFVASTLATGGSGKIPRSVERCCVVDVILIRAVKDESGRVFGVYDTAIEKQRAHASVFVRKDYLDKSKRLEARRLALALFGSNIVPLEIVRPAAHAQA